MRIYVLRISTREQREEVVIHLLVIIAHVFLQTLANIGAFSERFGVALPTRGLVNFPVRVKVMLRKPFARISFQILTIHRA